MHNGLVYNCRSGNVEKWSDQKCITEIQPAVPSDSKNVGQERKEESGMYVGPHPAELDKGCSNFCNEKDLWKKIIFGVCVSKFWGDVLGLEVCSL